MTMCISTRNFPTMKSYIGAIMRGIMSILLCLLAYQNLVTVKTTFIFFVPLKTTNDEELPADRKKFIPVELVSKDVLSHDVPEKEANMYWRDFTRSVDNMDVINSVKNRNNKQHHNTPSFSTTEYSAGFQDNGSTLLFFPLQLCIPVDFNNNNVGNNIDFNLIAFCLQSSLVHHHQLTDTVLLPAMIISMIHEIDFDVPADKIISGARFTTSLASAHGERLLLHQDSSYDVEETRPPATIITGIILLSVNTTAPINTEDYYVDTYVAHSPLEYSFALINLDSFPWNMHHCHLSGTDYSNYDGGGVWKMPMTFLQSDSFSVSRRVIGPHIMSYLSDIVRVMHLHTHPFVYVTPYKEETVSYCNDGVVNEDGEAYCFKSPSNSGYISVFYHEHVHHRHKHCLIHRDNEVADGNGRSKLPSDSPYRIQDALMINALMIRLALAYHVCSHAMHIILLDDYGEPADCSIGSEGGACSIGSKEEGLLYGTFKSRNGSTNLLVPLQVTALLSEINYSQSTVLDAWQQPLLLGNIRSNYDSILGDASYPSDYSMRIDDGEDIYYALYHILQSIRRVRKGYLADHGTYGDIQHGNLRPISEIYGVYVDHPSLVDEKFGTRGDMCVTQLRPITITSQWCALFQRGCSIYANTLLKVHSIYVEDGSGHAGDQQHTTPSNDYGIFLSNGLSSFHIRPFIDQGLAHLPYIAMTSDLPRCSFSFNFVIADGPYCFEEQFCNPNSQTIRIYSMSWAHFIACNILCCRQAFELGAIFFDIEAWGECLCCLFCEDRRGHYVSANGLLMDSQFAGNLEEEMRYRETMDFLISDRAQAVISARVRRYLQALQMDLLRAIQQYFNWTIDRKLHAITYAHLVGTTRDAIMLRDDDVGDICLKGNTTRNNSRGRRASSVKPTSDGTMRSNTTSQVRNPNGESTFTSDELVGKTVLLNTRDDGQRFKAEIFGVIEEFESESDRNPELLKFRCKVGDANAEEIISYKEMMRLIEEQVANDTRDNDLIEAWDERRPSLKLRRHAKNAKTLILAINAAKRSSYKSAPVHMFGHRVPRNHDEAVGLDKANGNTKWQDSDILERDQLLAYHHTSKERISADRPSFDVCVWFDTTTTAASHGIGDIPVKRIGHPTSCHLDRIKRLYAYAIKVEHVFIRYRTGMPDIANVDWGAKVTSNNVDWGAKVTSSVEVCEHNTTWNAQALSSVAATSAVMICASSPCTIILSRRLLRLSIQLHSFDMYLSGNTNDLLDNGTSYQFPTPCCFGIRTSPRFCEHGSADSTKISSCTPSTEYGEHLLWVMDKLFGVNSIRCVVDSTENHSLFGIDGVVMQQLEEHLMQQLMKQRWMDLAYYYSSRNQHRRSVIMVPFDTNLNASVRSYNVPSTSNVVTTNGELRFFAMGGNMPLDRHHEVILSSALVTRCTAAGIVFMSMAYASCIDMYDDMSSRPRYTAYGMRPFIFYDMLGHSACITMSHRLDILAPIARNNLITFGSWHVRNSNVWNHQIASLHQCHNATLHHRVQRHIHHDTRIHNLMCGFELSNSDILHEHWICSYLILGFMIGLIMLLQCATRNHTLQTTGLVISISSRRGVTPGKDVRVCTDLIPICKYMCNFQVSSYLHRQTTFREGNARKSTMVILTV